VTPFRRFPDLRSDELDSKEPFLLQDNPDHEATGAVLVMVVEAMGVVLAMVVGAMVCSFKIFNCIFLMSWQLMEMPGDACSVVLFKLKIRPCRIVRFI